MYTVSQYSLDRARVSLVHRSINTQGLSDLAIFALYQFYVTKASYRHQMFNRGLLPFIDIDNKDVWAAAVSELIGRGLVKKNKAGAASLVA